MKVVKHLVHCVLKYFIHVCLSSLMHGIHYMLMFKVLDIYIMMDQITRLSHIV